MPHHTTRLPVFHLAPPYDGTAATPFLGRSTRTVPGSVLAIHICEQSTKLPELAATAAELRARWPALPVVGWAEEPSIWVVQLAALGAHLHLRTVLCGNSHHEWALRHVLSSRRGLGRRVVRWLSVRDMSLAPRSAELIEWIIDLATRVLRGSSAVRILVDGLVCLSLQIQVVAQ